MLKKQLSAGEAVSVVGRKGRWPSVGRKPSSSLWHNVQVVREGSSLVQGFHAGHGLSTALSRHQNETATGRPEPRERRSGSNCLAVVYLQKARCPSPQEGEMRFACKAGDVAVEQRDGQPLWVLHNNNVEMSVQWRRKAASARLRGSALDL